MVDVKTNKKSRLIVDKFQNLDSFVVPAGMAINNISLRKAGVTPGKFRLGTSRADSVAEVISVVVTAAPTAAGDVSITLRDATPVLIPVLGSESIAQTVTAIADGTYPGWTAVETLGTTITWTAVSAGMKVGANAITGPTAFAITGPTVDVSGKNALAADDVVASVAISTEDNNVSNLTSLSAGWSNDTEVFIGCLVAADEAAGGVSIASGKLVIEMFNPF